MTFTALLIDDNTIDIKATQKISEGDECKTASHEKDADASFFINVAATTYQERQLVSETPGFGKDYASTHLFVINGNVDPRESRIFVTGLLYLHDNEIWPEKDQSATLNINEEFGLSNLRRSLKKSWSKCAGGEVRGEIDAYFLLLPNGSLVVQSYHRLYEGTLCGTTDLEDEGVWDTVILPGAESDLDMRLDNSEDDKSRAIITISNIGRKAE